MVGQAFDAQMERITTITGKRTQLELAALLGVTQSALSDAKRRRKIPASWLIVLMRLKNVHPEWILTGEGPCFMTRPSKDYETGQEAAERQIAEESARRLPSRVLAEELVRRIVIAEQAAYCINQDTP